MSKAPPARTDWLARALSRVCHVSKAPKVPKGSGEGTLGTNGTFGFRHTPARAGGCGPSPAPPEPPPAPTGWSADDWLAFFDERAGVAEFDGGLPRAEAERQAFEACIVEWLNRSFAPSDPAAGCAACGGPETAREPLLPCGGGVAHVWLHSGCWGVWMDRRRAEAIAALAGHGVGVA